MPRGINRPVSQTGTRPPLCMLDRRCCGCLETRANLLQWLDMEMKGADLEKFKGRVSLTVDPHLCFSLSSLPACQPLLIFHLTFAIASSGSPLFVSIFHTRPHLNFICLVYSSSLLVSLSVRSVIGQLSQQLQGLRIPQRLWVLLYMCLVLLTLWVREVVIMKWKENYHVTERHVCSNGSA